MAESSPKKSTIVRALSQRTMETLAPELVARRVTDRWFRLPAGPGPAAPLPPGGESFVVVWEHGRVRGWTWGEGPIVYLVHG